MAAFRNGNWNWKKPGNRKAFQSNSEHGKSPKFNQRDDAAGHDVAKIVTLNIGKFIQAIIDFIIVAFCVFMMVKGMNSLKKKEASKPVEPPSPSKEEVLLTEIRDLLKK